MSWLGERLVSLLSIHEEFPRQACLIVVLTAIVGAFLHPLALLIALAPLDTRGLVGFVINVREQIANLLG